MEVSKSASNGIAGQTRQSEGSHARAETRRIVSQRSNMHADSQCGAF